MHDLFKASVGTFLKNVSWKYGEPDIRKVEHCHWFHTFNSQGRPQKYTNVVGGHYHKIDWKVDEKGEMVATCGPALHKIVKKSRNGSKRKIEQHVQWDDFRENASDDEKIRDRHTHVMEYILSEEMDADSVRKLRNSHAGEIIAANEARQGGTFENDEVKMTGA